MVAESVRSRPDLCLAVFIGGYNFPSAKNDVDGRSQSANANYDDSNAIVYRLDKFAISGGLGALLGNHERRTDNSTVVDEQAERQGGGLNGESD